MELSATGWTILGTRFRCLGLPPGEEADLAALLRGFPAGAPAEGAVEIRVEEGEGGGRVLAAGSGPRWALPPEGPLSPHVEYRCISEALARARHHHVLHAGAVAGPRGTCLVVGESGAGKTSLTLWLWAHGLRLGTDDLCPIAHGTLAPEWFPRALHMDAAYSPRLIEKIPPRPASYPADYYPFPEPGGEAPPPVTDLLVIERGPRPEGELEPLRQSEAVHRLLGAVIKHTAFDYGRALGDMMRLAAGCSAFHLRSGTPEGAGERALALLTRS